MYKNYQIDKDATGAIAKQVVNEIAARLGEIQRLASEGKDLNYLCSLSAKLSDIIKEYK